MLLKIKPEREDVLIARFAAFAIGIHVLESVLPSPIPGIKPGFANIVTLLVFMLYGVGSAAWVSILRVMVGSLIVGTFLSPTFVLSFSGAIVSLCVLYCCDRFNKRFLTPENINSSYVIDNKKTDIKHDSGYGAEQEPGNRSENIKLSVFSIALLMSMAHMATQFLVVYVFFIPHRALLDLLPIMMSAALIFGAINGIISHKVYEKVR